jgi:predicted nucleic acid-binding protein
MIVVDTNIIGYLYLSSERSTQAEQALRRDPYWVAPLLWRSELRNVLGLYIRRRILRLEQAQQIMEEAAGLMLGREYEVISAHVLRLVAASTCSAYDCEFVALAEDLNLPLLTADQQILNQFPGRAVALEHYIGGDGDVV